MAVVNVLQNKSSASKLKSIYVACCLFYGGGQTFQVQKKILFVFVI